MKIRKVVITALAMMLVVSCAGKRKGVYVSRSIDKTYDASLDRVYDAAISALEALEIQITNKPEKDKLRANIDADLADGTSIKITMKARENHTDISIRVGVLGDEEASRIIMKEVNKYVTASKTDDSKEKAKPEKPAAPATGGNPEAAAETAPAAPAGE